MPTVTLQHAQRLWSYLSSERARAACDAVIVCCSYDLRVCDYACQLMQHDLAPILVLSGNTGNWTRHLYEIPEARVFNERALANGTDPARILIEEASTNFGENVANVRSLLPDCRRVTFVTKPNSVARVNLTVPIQWPGIEAWVDAPPLAFPDEVSPVIGLFGVIDEMVGDLHRIIHYPARGFQVSHRIPGDVLDSWQYLISQGFNRHLLTAAG